MANPKPTPSEATQFKPGNSGRKPGSRNKINERALALIDEVLAEDDGKLAKAALVKARDEEPVAFWRMIVGLMPKELHITDVNPFELFSDEEVEALLARARLLAPRTIEGEAVEVH